MKKKIIIVFVFIALLLTFLFIHYFKSRPLPVEKAPVAPSPSSKAEPVTINPAGVSTNLPDEIGRLQNLAAQVPENSPLAIRLEFAKGETYVKYGKLDFAIESFNKVISMNPADKKSYYYLGELYIAKGDVQKGVKMWKIFLQKDPSSYKRNEIESFIKANGAG